MVQIFRYIEILPRNASAVGTVYLSSNRIYNVRRWHDVGSIPVAYFPDTSRTILV